MFDGEYNNTYNSIETNKKNKAHYLDYSNIFTMLLNIKMQNQYLPIIKLNVYLYVQLFVYCYFVVSFQKTACFIWRICCLVRGSVKVFPPLRRTVHLPCWFYEFQQIPRTRLPTFPLKTSRDTHLSCAEKVMLKLGCPQIPG